MNKMQNMWDSRYSNAEYAYGTTPNAFLKSVLDRIDLTGKILFPAEGEGRNAVYAAKKNLQARVPPAMNFLFFRSFLRFYQPPPLDKIV